MASTESGVLARARHIKDKYSVRMTLFTGHLLNPLHLSRADMTGKNIIITGANSGLGFDLALKLVSMHANVFMACRNPQKAEDARQRILKEIPGANLTVLALDASSLQSVRDFAYNWKGGSIDILLNNAGIATIPEGKDFTVDGLEMMYQTNVLSSFLLTHLLEPHFAPKCRVIFTSSMGAYGGAISDGFAATRFAENIERGFHSIAYNGKTKVDSDFYFQSKLMQIALVRLLQQRFDRDQQNQRLALAWEPGVVKTGLDMETRGFSKDPAYAMVNWCMSHTGVSVEQGAATGVYVTVSEDDAVVKNGKGQFFSRCVTRLNPASFYSQEKLDRLWSRWTADAGITWT